MTDQIDISRDIVGALPGTLALQNHRVPADSTGSFAYGLACLALTAGSVAVALWKELAPAIQLVPIAVAITIVFVLAVVSAIRARNRHKNSIGELRSLEVRAGREIAALESQHPRALVIAAKPYRDFLIQANPSLIAELAEYPQLVARPSYYLRCAQEIERLIAEKRRIELAQSVLSDKAAVQ